MKSYVNGLILSIQFFTIIPIRKEIPLSTINVERMIQMFPLLGLFQGLLFSSLVYTLYEWTVLSTFAVAFFLWLLTIVITGGFHLDGWIDTSDAFFSYRDQNKRLAIMSDPKVGAFGVLSVIVLLVARLFFIVDMFYVADPPYLLLIVLPIFGKMFMGLVICRVPVAKQEGLGYLFQKSHRRSTFYIYVIFLLLFIYLFRFDWIILCLMIGLLFIVYLFLRKSIVRNFGGVTGDVAGAAVEGMELLLWMIVWLSQYGVMG